MAIDKYGYIVYILPAMYLLLNHSTGTLILDAKDRNDALSWIERQLGSRAGSVSILQLDELPGLDCVEKSGTGIRQAEDDMCEARLSFMADSVQGVTGLDHELLESFEWNRRADLRSCKASMH